MPPASGLPDSNAIGASAPADARDSAALAAIKAVVGDKGWIETPADMAPYLQDHRDLYTGRCQAVVRPASREEVADAIKRALTMPLNERRRKWECLMQVVRDTDVGVWRNDFVATLRAVVRPADGDADDAVHAA